MYVGAMAGLNTHGILIALRMFPTVSEPAREISHKIMIAFFSLPSHSKGFPPGYFIEILRNGGGAPFAIRQPFIPCLCSASGHQLSRQWGTRCALGEEVHPDAEGNESDILQQHFSASARERNVLDPPPNSPLQHQGVALVCCGATQRFHRMKVIPALR